MTFHDWVSNDKSTYLWCMFCEICRSLFSLPLQPFILFGSTTSFIYPFDGQGFLFKVQK